MPRVGIVLYKPRKGKEQDLLNHMRSAFPMLRRNGLITDRKVIGMRTKDGRVMVVFEWVSEEAMDSAGEHPEVQKYWMEADRISSFGKPADVPELQRTLPDFEPVDVE